ncbi:hypothetical protein WAZ07_08095 [Bacillus sp. FJAT-51639]|uniref:Uncharacterized protein n=1 Tax=Bacillus bruguierae TaxID=3127667 RepID=A0ABU8FFK7_9BACI
MKSEIYKGIEIAVKKNSTHLFIDGKEIGFWLNPNTGQYFTYRLPYSQFPSLELLAEAVIDYVPSYQAKIKKK